MAQFIKAELMV